MYLASHRLLKSSLAITDPDTNNWDTWTGTTDGPVYSFLTALVKSRYFRWFPITRRFIHLCRVPEVSFKNITTSILSSIIGGDLNAGYGLQYFSVSRNVQVTNWKDVEVDSWVIGVQDQGDALLAGPELKNFIQQRRSNYFADDSFYSAFWVAYPFFLPINWLWKWRNLWKIRASYTAGLYLLDGIHYTDVLYYDDDSHKLQRIVTPMWSGVTKLLDHWSDCIVFSNGIPMRVGLVHTADYTGINVHLIHYADSRIVRLTLSGAQLGIAPGHVLGSDNDSSLGGVVLSDETFAIFYRCTNTGINYVAHMRYNFDNNRVETLQIQEITSSKATNFIGFNHGKRVNDNVSLMRLGSTVHMITRDQTDPSNARLNISQPLTDTYLSRAFFVDNLFFTNVDDNSFIIYDDITETCRFYFDMGTSVSPRIQQTQNSNQIIQATGDFLPYTFIDANRNAYKWEVVTSLTPIGSPQNQKIFDAALNRYVYYKVQKERLTVDVRLRSFGNINVPRKTWNVFHDTEGVKTWLLRHSKAFVLSSNKAGLYINYKRKSYFLSMDISVSEPKRISFQLAPFRYPFIKGWFNAPAYYYSNNDFVDDTLSDTVYNVSSNIVNRDGGAIFSKYGSKYYGYYFHWDNILSSPISWFPFIWYPTGAWAVHWHWWRRRRYYYCYYHQRALWITLYYKLFDNDVNPKYVNFKLFGYKLDQVEEFVQDLGNVSTGLDDRFFVMYKLDADTLRFDMYAIVTTSSPYTLSRTYTIDFDGVKPNILIHPSNAKGTIVYLKNNKMYARQFTFNATTVTNMYPEYLLNISTTLFSNPRWSVMLDETHIMLYVQEGKDQVVIYCANDGSITTRKVVNRGRRINYIARLSNTEFLVDCSDNDSDEAYFSAYIMSNQ